MPATITLHQAVALESGIRAKTYRKTTDLWKFLQKPGLFSGLSRVYEPLDDEGEQLPPESTQVQMHAETVLRQGFDELARQWDITATRDWGNCTARADVVVDGRVIIASAPTHFLLWAAKQLQDVRAVILALPVHDPADVWRPDQSSGLWKTDPPVRTRKTSKVPRNHVRATATDKHPAQVDTYFEDVTVGHWVSTKTSGAVPATRQAQLLSRVEALQEAVTRARQVANATEVPEVEIGNIVLGWVLAR